MITIPVWRFGMPGNGADGVPVLYICTTLERCFAKGNPEGPLRNSHSSATSPDIWNNARKLCCGAQIILATFVGVYGCKRAGLRHINVVNVEIIYNSEIR
jgi:hypothetical protein